jgi:hypothetical protein
MLLYQSPSFTLKGDSDNERFRGELFLERLDFDLLYDSDLGILL